MLVLRSILYSIVFYTTTLVYMVVFTPPYFFGPKRFAWWVVKFWSRSNQWFLKLICNLDHEVSGLEKLPDGGYVISPKHQSAWDTFAFLPWWPEPTFVLKRELMWIPLFGWYMQRVGQIAIDRGSREEAIKSINAGVERAIAEHRQVVIYPEGTRRPPGATPSYKSGIYYIYKQIDAPVVPIAHVAGLFWPKNSFRRYPGLIKVEILDPIEPGLSKDDFMKTLIKRTEDACDRLLLEVYEGPNPPPFPAQAKARVEELKQREV